jgi:hypothetical protein
VVNEQTRWSFRGPYPMRTLQEYMGHGDIQTTQIYADYAPSVHEVAQVNAAFAVEIGKPVTA